MANKETNSKSDKSTKKKGLSTQAVVLIVVSVVILSAAAVIVAMLLRPEAVPIPAPPPSSGVSALTEENFVEIGQQVKEQVEKSRFRTYMNTTWRFPDGESASSNAVMGNSSANVYPMYFTVTLSDTDEVVFTSGVLPVGTQISEIVLEKDLDPGTYSAVVSVHMVDENGEATGGNAGFNVDLVIQG